MGGGGVLPETGVEVCGRLAETLNLFQTKTAIFPTLFLTDLIVLTNVKKMFTCLH